MSKILSNFILTALMVLVFLSCANRGNPDGGPKDETPPVIEKAEPENFSTNFKRKEIKIYFNEYIKIKDLEKQLVISPPMATRPEIYPIGGASKNITIKIKDTLHPNTTYAFNFGNSITDNNEGNPYPFYRYVFSTGNYIDSLTVKGSIVDALKRTPETFVSVGLYEIDSTFKDSVIYKKAPKYMANTLDSLTAFSIENIKEGTYMLMALKDKNGDNKFQQKGDQIAFHKSFIEVPTDSLYTLKLFSEDLDFKAKSPKLVSGGKIIFGYEGDYENVELDIKSDVPETYVSRIIKDKKTDTLYYWYKPKLEVDSLLFEVLKGDYKKDVTVRISDKKRDSLKIDISPSGSIGYEEPFKISGTTPLVEFDNSKISIRDKDSTFISYKAKFNRVLNTYDLTFDKTENNTYKIQILPEAIIDFFGDSNDTLNYSIKTRKSSDFGYIRFNLNNAKYPLIIQLTDDSGNVKYEQYATQSKTLDFFNLDSGKYFIRVIFDANGNKTYDSGSYLKKIQPERVIHFKMDEEIRPDWGLIQTLNFIE